MQIPMNRFFVLSVAAMSIACSGQVDTATRAQPNSGEAGADDSAPPGEAGLDATPDTMWDGAEASVWGDAAVCPLFACQVDGYFPAEPLIRAEDVEPGLRFLRVSQAYVLAMRSVNGVDEPAVVRIPLGGEPAQLITASTGSALHPKAIAAGKNVPHAFGVLMCSDDDCEVLVPPEAESDIIVPHPAGTVPVPGQPDTLVMVTLEGEPSLCVLGDGASCIQSGVWKTWIEPGNGPRIRAMAAGYDRVMFVGDAGRVISFSAEGRKDGVIDPTQDLTHVVFRSWDGVVVLGQGEESTIWSSAGDGWSSCPGVDHSDVLVLSAVNGTLRGVRGFGTPFEETVHDEQLFWLDACPFDEESFHGELIDGDVFPCAAGINYLGLQPDALQGTADCPMGY